MKMKNRARATFRFGGKVVFSVGSLLAGASCAPGAGPKEGVASVQLAIREAPADAACLRVNAVGTKTVTRLFGLTPGQTTVFSMGALPTGSVVFSADAFNQPCSTSDFSSASYVSDQVVSVLKSGNNGQVVLTMHGRANTSLAVEFPGVANGKWVSFGGAPVGTPASVKAVADNSDGSTSVFDIAINGYFLEEKTVPDNRKYTRLSVPGLGSMGQVGSPDLPALRMDLAVPSSVQAVAAEVEVLDSVELPVFLAWPSPEPGSDQTQEVGNPDKFVINEKVYEASTVFPRAIALAQPATAKLGSIRGASLFT